MKYISSKAYYKASETEAGVVEAYVSVFGNVDSYGDRVMLGAFTKSLEAKAPKMVWQHDLTRPVGKTLEAREVPAGDTSLPDELKEYGALWVKGAFNLNTTDGKDAYEHIKFGSVDEYSFGYEEIASTPNEDGTKSLTELRIVEWSPVTLGANPLTLTASVKSLGLEPKADILEEAFANTLDHLRSHADMKEKAGAAISRVRRERLRGLAESAKEFYKELIKMLDEAEPQREEDAKQQLAILALKFQSLEN
ncbi:MAG: HK97 family phage prohead protease [Ignavibacteria bacterium]|nr:HK97 family phage prohead protease [Ignavibacteria bacterium]MBK7578530.1 HK97 family phage prohead protease [Ignavibacteria bacterium]